RRHVRDAHRIFFGDVSQAGHLIRGQHPHRDLDPLHLNALLALAIRAMAQPKFEEELLRHFAGLEAAQLGFVDVDFLADGLGEMSPARGRIDRMSDDGHNRHVRRPGGSVANLYYSDRDEWVWGSVP